MNENQKKFITVITVVKNGEKTISKCIESVINQNYKKIEYIIIDGKSTDETVQIIRRYQNDQIKLIIEEDTGIYNAINKALKYVTSEYYIVLGCDDELKEDCINILSKYIDKYEIVFGMVEVVNKKGEIINKIYNHSAGTLISIKIHSNLGKYDESYKIAADTLFIEKAKRKSNYVKIQEVVGKFSTNGISQSKAVISEHARAMIESKAWSKFYGYYWKTSRNIKNLIKIK